MLVEMIGFLWVIFKYFFLITLWHVFLKVFIIILYHFIMFVTSVFYGIV